MDYKKRIDAVYENIRKACMRSSRDPQDVRVIAAVKYAGHREIEEVLRLGLRDLGENRAEDLLEKKEKVCGDAVWHFIGHLQSRKIKKVVPIVDIIHSIDSVSTAKKISDFAEKVGKVQKILIEVNISGEETKYGIAAGHLWDFLQEAMRLEHVSIEGLMTMAPFTDETETVRTVFQKLRLLKEECNERLKKEGTVLKELSMGMTNDYAIAVEEGATMVRIGSAIFQ